MKKVIFTFTACLLLVFPLLISAAEITGTLTGYSIKKKILIVDKIEYFVDIENLSITYDSKLVGTDWLKPGLKVTLVFRDEDSSPKKTFIEELKILTHRDGMES